MKKLWILLALFLAGCSSGPDITSYFHSEDLDVSDLETDKSVTTISMILPLSGTWEVTGKSFQNASLLALDENPKSPVKLLFFDTQSSVEGTEDAYAQAVAQNPNIILGPIFADEFKAIPRIGLNNKPILGYTSDNTLLSSDRASLAVLIPEQINTIIEQNCLSGKHKLAVIGPEGKTGEIVMNSLTEALQKCPDMELQSYALYNAEKADMSADILKILPTFINPRKKDLTEEEQKLLAIPMEERLKFDSLLVFEDGTKLTQVMSILAFYDVTPTIVPIYSLTSAKAVKDRALNGLLMADLPANNTFIQKYKNAFGTTPVRLSSLAYDSINWISKEAQKGPVSLTTLREVDSYQGVDGLVRLNADGTNKRGLRMVRKTYRGVEEVSPAPTAFKDTKKVDLMNDSMITTESADSTSESPAELYEFHPEIQ